jgi:hypothetical protein
MFAFWLEHLYGKWKCKLVFMLVFYSKKGLIQVYLGVLQWLVDPVKLRRCCDSFL